VLIRGFPLFFVQSPLELSAAGRQRLMSNQNKDEMLSEYDFRGQKGARGKYYEALQAGHKTVIHKSDGSTVVRETRPIYLDEDLQKLFPNSEAVNRALRELISIKK
jgi:hypothetical protein